MDTIETLKEMKAGCLLEEKGEWAKAIDAAIQAIQERDELKEKLKRVEKEYGELLDKSISAIKLHLGVKMKPIIPEEREQYTQKQIKHNPTYINLNMKVAGYNAFRNELLTNLKERGVEWLVNILKQKLEEEEYRGHYITNDIDKLAYTIIDALTKGEK